MLSEKNYSAKKLAAPVGRNQCLKINVLPLTDSGVIDIINNLNCLPNNADC